MPVPKVREGHSEKKRMEILAAAKRVCQTKPLYNVTMKDIVLESGMSQGGVYKYFSNIDAIYVAILNEAHLNSQVKSHIDAILSSEASRWERMAKLLYYLGRYIQDMIQTGGRIRFEMLMLYMNEPARFVQIREQLLEVSVLTYVRERLQTFVLEAVAEGSFAPLVPVEDLFSFMAFSINGIVHELIAIQRNPEAHHGGPAPEVDRLFHVLSTALKALLGIEQPLA